MVQLKDKKNANFLIKECEFANFGGEYGIKKYILYILDISSLQKFVRILVVIYLEIKVFCYIKTPDLNLSN